MAVTFPFKEGYIKNRHYKTNKITTDSKSGAVKGNIASNRFGTSGNGRKNVQNPHLQIRGISPMALVVEGGHIAHELIVKGTVNFIREPSRSRKT